MGQDAGVVFDVEVVPEDGGHELWQTRIADIGGAAEGTSPPPKKKDFAEVQRIRYLCQRILRQK